MRVLLAVVFGMLALATLIIIGYLFLSDARKRAAAIEEENKRNQEAILRLLNEMGDLADGDLTVRATLFSRRARVLTVIRKAAFFAQQGAHLHRQL